MDVRATFVGLGVLKSNTYWEAAGCLHARLENTRLRCGLILQRISFALQRKDIPNRVYVDLSMLEVAGLFLQLCTASLVTRMLRHASICVQILYSHHLTSDTLIAELCQ